VKQWEKIPTAIFIDNYKRLQMYKVYKGKERKKEKRKKERKKARKKEKRKKERKKERE
jgi:hypothetical protein